MKSKYGEVIELVWPEGNDDGELFIRGHFGDSEAREILLHDSQGLEAAESALLDEDDRSALDSASAGDPRVELIEQARVERIYARWSQEASFDEGTMLRPYREPGRGRFPVTRVTLFPSPPCRMSLRTWTGVYRCLTCSRRFRGPSDPHNLTGPADCNLLVGDEQVGEHTEVYEELPSEQGGYG